MIRSVRALPKKIAPTGPAKAVRAQAVETPPWLAKFVVDLPAATDSNITDKFL